MSRIDDKDVEREVRKEFPLFFLEMNEAQERFIRVKNKAGRSPRRRINEMGNKCLTADSFIDTVSGPKFLGDLYEAGKPFGVWSWDGKRRVPALAEAPIKYEGLHLCY